MVLSVQGLFQLFSGWRFRSQLILWLSVTVLFLSLIGSFFNSWFTSKLLYENEFDLSVSRVQHLAVESTLFLVHRADESIATVVENLILYTSIDHVLIFNKQGVLVLSEGDHYSGRHEFHLDACENNTNVELSMIPIMVCDKNDAWHFKVGLFDPEIDNDLSDELAMTHVMTQVGYAYVIVDHSWLVNIRQTIFIKDMTREIIALSLALFLVYWFTGRLVKPLDNLSRLMKAAEGGDLAVRSDSGGSQEVRQMEHAFNSMLSVLEVRSATLNWQRKQLSAEIVEKNKKEQALIESESRYRAVIDNASEAIVTINQTGVMVAANHAATEIFGYQINELVGSNIMMLMPVEKHAAHAAGLSRYNPALTSRNTGDILEVEGVHKDGRLIALELSLGVVGIEGETHITGIIRDVTERKQVQLELEAYRDHLEEMIGERTSALVIARDDALAGERAMSAFLANMSHELRTPLHGILSFSRLGMVKLEQVPLEKLLQYFVEINDSGNGLLMLLSDLLDLSKLKAGKVVYDFSEHKMNEIIDAVTREYAALKSEKNITISIDMPDADIRVICDGNKILQIIRNLLSNALKFSPAESSIVIGCHKRKNGEVLIQVIDEGVGVPDSERDSIFDAFSQSSKTRTAAGGTGLGLAICKGIVEVGHRGQIWVENNPQVGATFSFTIAAGLMTHQGETRASC